MTAEALAGRVAAGDRRAVARALSAVEDRSPDAPALMALLHARGGRAWTIGMTGPPGAGKSTLVDRLTAALRSTGATVGILAVDPTSPYTGGAILGDRVRMQAHALDPGVFIRSMATRGHLGGLSRATGDATLVLDAAGFDVILIETVGVGQAEVDIVGAADVCVVTLVPGAGDEVQALKAGIMEIADIFVVNKADREGADRAAETVEAMLGLQPTAPGRWRPPVLKTVAATGEGVDALAAALARFRADAEPEVARRRRQRSLRQLRDRVAEVIERRVEAAVPAGELESLAARIADRAAEPYATAAALVERVAPSAPPRPDAMRLDHVGIAVRDLPAAAAFYREALGLDVSEPHEVPTERVRVAFVPVGQAALELLEATSEASAIARSIASRGPGLHHITLRVPDLDAALGRLRALGVRLVDQSARPGAHGARVAFIHPSAAGGVLVELTQMPGGDRP